jgi:serine/threonine-protein kinase
MKMLMQHVHARPVPPSERTELRIPRELDELVLACLEKDPNARPQNAEELFRMACGCTSCESWNQTAARTWWQTHLPDLTGPLTLAEPDVEPVGSAVAAI